MSSYALKNTDFIPVSPQIVRRESMSSFFCSSRNIPLCSDRPRGTALCVSPFWGMSFQEAMTRSDKANTYACTAKVRSAPSRAVHGVYTARRSLRCCSPAL